MSDIAEQLTGMSKSELLQVEFEVAMSSEDVQFSKGVRPRGNVRLYSGLVVGADDRAERREAILNHIPESLRED